MSLWSNPARSATIELLGRIFPPDGLLRLLFICADIFLRGIFVMLLDFFLRGTGISVMLLATVKSSLFEMLELSVAEADFVFV